MLLNATIAVMLTPIACAAHADEKTELAKLEGTWIVVGAEEEGKSYDLKARRERFKDGDFKDYLVERVVIKDNMLEWFREGSAEKTRLTFKLDLTTTPHSVAFDGGALAAYSVEKNSLKVAMYWGDKFDGLNDKKRLPTEFKTKKGDGIYIYVFDRAKNK